MRRTRTNATRAGVVAATLTALLATTTPGAQAAVRDHDVVSRADIVRVFPKFRNDDYLGGFVVRDKVLSYPNPAACSTWSEATGTSGREYGTGYGLTVQKRTFNTYLVEFATAAQAKQIVRSTKAYVAACAQHWAGLNATVRPARLPRLGDQRVAFRLVEYYSTGPKETTTIVLRKRKRVLITSIMQPKTIPARKVAQIARVCARKMG